MCIQAVVDSSRRWSARQMEHRFRQYLLSKVLIQVYLLVEFLVVNIQGKLDAHQLVGYDTSDEVILS